MSLLPNKNLEKDILAAIMKHSVPIWEAKRALAAVERRLESMIIPKEIMFRYSNEPKGDFVTYEDLVATTFDEDGLPIREEGEEESPTGDKESS